MVGQHDNGLAAAGNLHRAFHNAVRQNIRPVYRLDDRALQLAGHAVTVGGQLIAAVGEGLLSGGGEGLPLGARHCPQKRQTPVLFPPPQTRPGAGGGVAQRVVRLAAVNGFPPGGGAVPGHGDGQHIPLAESAALEAAQVTGKVGGAAAAHHRHQNAAPNRQVAAQSLLCHADFQHTAGRRKQRCKKRHRLAIQLGRCLGTGQGKDRRDLKPQFRAAQGGFQNRVSGSVAHQQVGKPGGIAVGGAAAAVAVGCRTAAAQVLHGGQRAGVQNADAHGLASFSASAANCSGVMAENLIRSPAA